MWGARAPESPQRALMWEGCSVCDPFLKNKMDAVLESLGPVHPKYHIQNMTVELTVVFLGSIVGVLVSIFAPFVPEAKEVR